MNREEYEKHISMSLAMICSKEEHQNIMEHLHSLSDDDFILTVEEMKNGCSENISEKEKMKIQHEVMKKRDCLDTGLDNLPAAFLSETENNEWLNSISKSRPTNLIMLDNETAMINLWRSSNQTATGIPSDLFFSGNIPLPDCRIQYTDSAGNEIQFRTVIFPDYQDRIRFGAEDSAVQVGMLAYEFNANSSIIFSIEVLRGHDWLMTIPFFGYKGLPAVVRESISQSLSIAECFAQFSQFTGVWYGVQIALLHPLVKDIFLNPATVVDTSANKRVSNGKKGKKRPLRYIKRHILNAEELKKRIHRDGNFQRHTLVWYVMGHWRKYADGRKIFIQPYWKGALRDLKNSEIREREIVLEGNT